MRKNLVVGIGNTLLGDDGIGPVLCREMASILPENVRKVTDFRESNSIGMDLLLEILEYDRVLLLDSYTTAKLDPGIMIEIPGHKLRQNASPCHFHTHGFSLGDLFAFADSMGFKVPAELDLIAITIAESCDFRETLSAPVQKSLPGITIRLQERISGWN